jgi:hypothetical protein
MVKANNVQLLYSAVIVRSYSFWLVTVRVKMFEFAKEKLIAKKEDLFLKPEKKAKLQSKSQTGNRFGNLRKI